MRQVLNRYKSFYLVIYISHVLVILIYSVYVYHSSYKDKAHLREVYVMEAAAKESTAKRDKTVTLATAAMMAALCYAGYAVFPAFNASGTKIHIGNSFVVLGSFLTGGVYGGLAGAVGLSLADVLGGFAASAPRTFICKFMIGLVSGTVAHKLGHLSKDHPAGYITKWSALAAIAGLAFNCVFEPSLKYVWYTVLTPNADKAASAIKALLALTTYTTFINAIINSVLAVIMYAAIRPALKKAGLFREI